MKLLSENEIARLFGVPHQTVSRHLQDQTATPGKNRAKMHPAAKVIPLLCTRLGLSVMSDKAESAKERRELAAARREELELEILEGKWVRVSDAVEVILDRYQAMAATLKAARRRIPVPTINELLAKLAGTSARQREEPPKATKKGRPRKDAAAQASGESAAFKELQQKASEAGKAISRPRRK
jgi:predicted transcriptional regulator